MVVEGAIGMLNCTYTIQKKSKYWKKKKKKDRERETIYTYVLINEYIGAVLEMSPK